MIFITFYNQLHHDNMWMGPHKPRNITGGPCTQYEHKILIPLKGCHLTGHPPEKRRRKVRNTRFRWSSQFSILSWGVVWVAINVYFL